MPEQLIAPAELNGHHVDLVFTVEPCGSAGPGRHLYQYVCEGCRAQNARGRDEWVSSSFLDEESDEARERTELALDDIAKHIHAHEIIGAWAAMSGLKQQHDAEADHTNRAIIDAKMENHDAKQ